MNNKKEKIIVILGATATGKTSLGVYLAHKYNGEIISADSRQVYKGMDIGTGKDLADYKFQYKSKGKLKTENIPYHLMDVVSPQTEFNLAKYCKLAEEAIRDILGRDKLPIIVGGSGLYLQALVDGYDLSKVKAQPKLREKLEKLSAREIFLLIRKQDKKFADNLNNSERNNKRHLIRYYENIVNKNLGKLNLFQNKDREFLVLGLRREKEDIDKRIYKRLIERIEKEGMIEEIKNLHSKGVTWKRLEDFGLEYRFVSFYLKGKMGLEEMQEKLFIAIRQFAKRQITWFRRWEGQGRKIYWISNKTEANKLIKNFLK